MSGWEADGRWGSSAAGPRILHLITRLDLGGAQLATLDLVEGLRSRFRLDVALAAGPDNVAGVNLHARARQAGA